MNIYSLTEARRRLSELLDLASREGEVRIRRGDGRTFLLRPCPDDRSPLDVQGVPTDLRADEIVKLVRDGRERP